ncbi:hypothetical protein ADUPG1_002752, partial [Aduncisulcus paluster]
GLVSEKEILATPTRAEEIELIDFNMNLSGEESGAFESFKDLSDFGSVAELGRRVNQFMVNTYMKVRGEQDKYPGVSITPEDLTQPIFSIPSIFPAPRTEKPGTFTGNILTNQVQEIS